MDKVSLGGFLCMSILVRTLAPQANVIKYTHVCRSPGPWGDCAITQVASPIFILILRIIIDRWGAGFCCPCKIYEYVCVYVCVVFGFAHHSERVLILVQVPAGLKCWSLHLNPQCVPLADSGFFFVYAKSIAALIPQQPFPHRSMRARQLWF